MKVIRAIYIFAILAFCGSLCSCGESSDVLYSSEHIGIYDTVTRQYIDIGDSKDKVNKILGYGTEVKGYYNNYQTKEYIEFDTPHYEYGNVLTIIYDNNIISSIDIHYYLGKIEDGYDNRFELSDGTNRFTVKEDISNKYPSAYIDGFEDFHIFLYKKNNNVFITDNKHNAGYEIKIIYDIQNELAGYEIAELKE
ncbi:MAG: hypothetical protein ACI4A5_01440 [Hominilimicola sp.]